MVCHVEKGENHMKIHSLKLKNFRGYKDELFISFGDLTAFLGRNDVGKSTILEALDIFFNDGKGSASDARRADMGAEVGTVGWRNISRKRIL